MNGKKLRRMHRAAMRQDGGLVQVTDSQGKKRTEKTDKYVPLRAWLRTNGNKVVTEAVNTWFKNKQLQKHPRRIIGPNDPHSPARLRRARKQVQESIAREQEREEFRKRKKASNA